MCTIAGADELEAWQVWRHVRLLCRRQHGRARGSRVRVCRLRRSAPASASAATATWTY